MKKSNSDYAWWNNFENFQLLISENLSFSKSGFFQYKKLIYFTISINRVGWAATLKMWIHHISTSWQCGSTTSPHFHNVEFPHLHIWQFDLYPLSNQYYFLAVSQVDSSMVHLLWQLSERWFYHIWIVGKIIFVSPEANLDWAHFSLLSYSSFLFYCLWEDPDFTEILLTGT